MPQPKQKFPPDMTAVLAQLVRHIFVTLNCVQIGKVQKFDSTNQTVDVTLQIKQIKSLDASGKPVFADSIVLAQFPALILSGGDSYISLPIQAGDDCIILFNDRDIDNWFQNGDGQPPNTYRCHDHSDGFALVGIRSLQTAIAGYLVNGIRMFMNDETKIDMTDNLISSLATLFLHTGNMKITGTLEVDDDADFKKSVLIEDGLTVRGHMHGNGGLITISDSVSLPSGTLEAAQIKSDNGASGTFNVVTVVNGIVISGS